MSSRSINSAKVSGVHLKQSRGLSRPNNRKNLSADFEAELVAPLQILGGLREIQAKLANRVCYSLLFQF